MSPSPQLAPPGSSTYSSDSLHVGDGTWDSQRNTFLLPNLMGLNFETMQYNGMGNRFREMTGYHPLIKAHGVIATIVFLVLIPGSIFLLRFYHDLRLARRLHMWIQVLTVFLTTVIFVLGWFAVGPERSLTNPHHGIGLAIYVLILVQMLWGWFVHKRVKGGRRVHIPLKLMVHHWMGRSIALLGIIQIPLGLTLYGSPKSLFVLFTLAAFALLLAFFILTYRHQHHGGSDYDSRGSYSSESGDDKHGGRFGRVAAAAGAAAGLGGLAHHFRRRSRSRSPSGSYTESPSYDEKDEKSGWSKKLLQFGAAAGGAALLKNLFDKRRDKRRDNDSDSESGRYRPAHTATDSLEDSISHAEEGRPRPPPGRHPRYDGPLSPGQSRYSESEFTRPDEGGHGLRNAILGGGALAGIKGFFKKRQDKEDDRRMEELRRAELEDEKLARARNRRYTGDGHPPRRSGGHSPVSELTGQSDSEAPHPRPTGRPHRDDDMSGYDSADPAERQPRRHHSSAATGAAAGAAAAGAAGADPSSSRRRRSGGREDSTDSHPVSIQVKTHDQGRRITLRQLTQEEASANRDARRRDRNRRSGRHRREGSLSGAEGDDHWRRVEEQERRQEEQLAQDDDSAHPTADPSGMGPPGGSPPPGPPPHASGTVPSSTGFSPLPRPPVPGAQGGIGSPISTELSGSYASRSGRRRAERRARAGGGRQHSVEFT